MSREKYRQRLKEEFGGDTDHEVRILVKIIEEISFIKDRLDKLEDGKKPEVSYK